MLSVQRFFLTLPDLAEANPGARIVAPGLPAKVKGFYCQRSRRSLHYCKK
jgi:hypothetical protein